VAFSNDRSRYYEVRGLVTGAGGEAGIQVDGGPDLPDNDLQGASILLVESAEGPVVQTQTLFGIDLVNDASDALNVVTAAIDQVAKQKAELGALQNRFEFTVSNLMNVVEFTSAARSRIQDADFAVEAVRLAKAQVLQQSGTAMLSQANAAPRLVLSLLEAA